MILNDLEFYCVEVGRTDSAIPVRSVLARLATDSGLEGWGESPITWRPAELSARRDVLLPVLAGRSIFDIEELHALEGLADAPLRCALEMASWDLVGRAAGQPLCHLFGGEFRRRIPLAVRLPGGSVSHVTGLSRELAEQGFHCQIVTSGGRPQDDLTLLAALIESSAERTELRFDADARYGMETVRELCEELESAGLQFLLDPLDTNDAHQFVSLGRQTNLPLAVGRAIDTPASVLAAVHGRAAQYVVIDPARVGGINPARRCAAVADAGGVHAVLGGGPSLGVATAAMLQLAASTPAFSTANESVYHELQDDVLSEPLEIADGMMPVPQSPGLGVEVDRAKVERYQVT